MTRHTPETNSSTTHRRLRLGAGGLVACLCLAGGVVASLMFGAVRIELPQVVEALLGTSGGDSSGIAHTIVWSARLPRALCALLAGANLAVAGALLQSVTRNPLADPGLIGVTAGAGVAATIVLAVLPDSNLALPVIAFIGAMIASVFVYAVSWRPGSGASPIRMILAGVAVNAILAAVIGLLITMYADRIPAVMFWTTGSFNGRSWPHVWQLLPYTCLGLVVALFNQRSMRVLELGDDTASTLGVRVERTRLIAFAASALLAGSAASVAGLLGFVGLVVPHLVRLVLGSNKGLLPIAAVSGASLLIWADLIARTSLAPNELPVGVVTGLIGGPYFIFLLFRSGWLR